MGGANVPVPMRQTHRGEPDAEQMAALAGKASLGSIDHTDAIALVIDRGLRESFLDLSQ